MTLTANKGYVLHNGQVYFLGDSKKVDFNQPILKHEYEGRNVVASTDKSLPVKHIDRSLFVKPAVDVEELYEQTKTNIGYESYDSQYEYFYEGYNSNPNQFTLEDMKNLWRLKDRETDNFSRAMELIRPLSIPPTIYCNENYDNIKCNW